MVVGILIEGGAESAVAASNKLLDDIMMSWYIITGIQIEMIKPCAFSRDAT